MIHSADNSLGKLALISAPLWLVRFITFLNGAYMGIVIFKTSSVFVPVWHFIIFVVWMLLLGLLEATSRTREPFINTFKFGVLVFLVFPILVNTISFNDKIFFLSLYLIISALIYDSTFRTHYRLVASVICIPTLVVPLFMGYILTTNSWPSQDLLSVGILYGVVMGIYFSAIEEKENFMKKNILLGLSVIGAGVCGIILFQYGIIYALMVVPLSISSFVSMFVKDTDAMHKIHNGSFIFYFLVGAIVTAHFFNTHPF